MQRYLIYQMHNAGGEGRDRYIYFYNGGQGRFAIVGTPARPTYKLFHEQDEFYVSIYRGREGNIYNSR
jgi:hypothetical protein